jgi:hypothetical protein
MERFWKAALGVAGVAAIAFFTFFSLYKQWLALPIFPQLSQQQAFILMLAFLSLTFLALMAGLIAWLVKGRTQESEDSALHRLEQAWDGVNYIDCSKLIGPDVNRAASALQMTSIYWRNGFISKRLLLERHGASYCELFVQLDECDKPVPGYTNPIKRCRDFLTAPVRSTYRQIKEALEGHHAVQAT